MNALVSSNSLQAASKLLELSAHPSALRNFNLPTAITTAEKDTLPVMIKSFQKVIHEKAYVSRKRL